MKGSVIFMNSMSREYSDPYRREKKDDYDNYRKEKEEKEEKKCPAIIKCGCPSSLVIPEGTKGQTTFTLASLTLDTSCLCDPDFILQFASNTIATEFKGALSIRVFKQCRCQVIPIPIGSTWILQLGTRGRARDGEEVPVPVTVTKVTDARTFSFFICDSDSCDKDCCTYTVVATVFGDDTLGTLAINNATLGAVATCSSNRCKKKCDKE